MAADLQLRIRARYLRRSLTPREVRLWVQLKAFNKEYGCHFRRQVPRDGRIIDFGELSAKLLIEVDGEGHGEPVGESSDRRRDAHFANTGFMTLRFWNHEIDGGLDMVCAKILEELTSRHPGLRGKRKSS